MTVCGAAPGSTTAHRPDGARRRPVRALGPRATPAALKLLRCRADRAAGSQHARACSMKIDERKILRGPQAVGRPGAWDSGNVGVHAARARLITAAGGGLQLYRPEAVRRARAALASGASEVDARVVAHKVLRELFADLVS